MHRVGENLRHGAPQANPVIEIDGAYGEGGGQLNLMRQYRPCYRAEEYPELDRGITRDEYEAALAAAERHGIMRLDHRVQRLQHAL